MNATDELRSLLDERGIVVDASDNDNAVYWFCGRAEYEQYSDGSTRLIVYDAIPEQAIAATVGGETCHVKAVKKMGDLFGFSLSCGHSMVNPFNDHPDYCPWCGRKVVG